MKESGSTNTRFTNRKGNKMFSDIFIIKMTRIFKAINKIFIMFVTIQNISGSWTEK